MEDKKEWIYINDQNNSIRYVLGTKGQKTLFCFGINPSTATPEKDDPTINKVKSIAEFNGYDSFLMLNVYPKRDTVFEDLEQRKNNSVHIKNIEIITKIIAEYSELDIWVAFGNHIYDRDYLTHCLKDIYKNISSKNINWLTTGINKSGAPKHPLYQKKTSMLFDFDMENYIKTL